MLTQLLPTIYAIRVPVEAHSFEINFSGDNYWLNYKSKNVYSHDVLLNVSEIEILGTVTQNEVDFDCSEIVESVMCDDGLERYKLYSDGGTWFAKRSLRSLLTSKGIEPTETEKVLIIKQL